MGNFNGIPTDVLLQMLSQQQGQQPAQQMSQQGQFNPADIQAGLQGGPQPFSFASVPGGIGRNILNALANAGKAATYVAEDPRERQAEDARAQNLFEAKQRMALAAGEFGQREKDRAQASATQQREFAEREKDRRALLQAARDRQKPDSLDQQYDEAIKSGDTKRASQILDEINQLKGSKDTKEPNRDDKAIAIMAKPKKTWTPDEQAYMRGYKQYVDMTKTQPGVLRIEALAGTRPIQATDTQTGQETITNMAAVNKQPGRYQPMPTGTTRTMQEMAASVRPQAQAIVSQVDALTDKLGPAAGRWNELWVNKAGFNDPDFAKLDENLGLLASAIVRTHFGASGGQQYMDALKKDFGEAQSPEDLKARISAADSWLEGYAAMSPRAALPQQVRSTSQATQGLAQAGQQGPINYQPGLVRNGYVFKGGDPTKQENWAKQ